MPYMYLCAGRQVVITRGDTHCAHYTMSYSVLSNMSVVRSAHIDTLICSIGFFSNPWQAFTLIMPW